MLGFVKTVIQMSVSSVWIISAVILFRLVLRRVPKQARVLMWILPAIRLTVPFAVESRFSVTPDFSKAAPAMSPSFVTPVSSADIFMTALWLAVTLGMLLYMLISFIRLKIRVRISLKLRDNIFICDKISSPFVLGMLRPKIYVPSDMDGKPLDYVLMHEQAHISRLDTLWKPAAFLILSVHWFNPLVWVAYVLFTRDIELACDERAIKILPFSERREYSTALLERSTNKYFTAACPFAFGEKPVKQRIKSILSYKKPKLVWKFTAVICCAAASLLFLTNPVTAKVVRESSAVVVDPAANLWYEPPTAEPETEPATAAPTEQPTEPPAQAEEAPAEEYAVEDEEIYYESEDNGYYEPEENSYSEADSDNRTEIADDWVDPQPYQYYPEEYFHVYDYASGLRQNGTFGSNNTGNSWDPFTDANGNNVLQWDYSAGQSN